MGVRTCAVAISNGSRGYELASVNVPPQKDGGGTVLLQITEGRIGTISVENAKLYRPERIKRELPDVQPGTIYNAAVFSDGMRQLNSLPVLKSRAILKPGAPHGSSAMMARFAAVSSEEQRVRNKCIRWCIFWWSLYP